MVWSSSRSNASDRRIAASASGGSAEGATRSYREEPLLQVRLERGLELCDLRHDGSTRAERSRWSLRPCRLGIEGVEGVPHETVSTEGIGQRMAHDLVVVPVVGGSWIDRDVRDAEPIIEWHYRQPDDVHPKVCVRVFLQELGLYRTGTFATGVSGRRQEQENPRMSLPRGKRVLQGVEATELRNLTWSESCSVSALAA